MQGRSVQVQQSWPGQRSDCSWCTDWCVCWLSANACLLLMVQEEDYAPTEKQEATMRGLCRELGPSFQQEVKPLTSQEAYSNKIGELLKQKKEKKAHDQAVSQCR